MTKKMGLIGLSLSMALLGGCTGADTSSGSESSNYSDSSDSSSGSYSGSCYDAGGGICGYYYNMSDAEYSDVTGQCSSGYGSVTWYDSDNVCDGNTQFNHRVPNGDSYTQICYMDTANSDSHLDVYNYGLTYDEAQWSEDQCYSHGGSSTISDPY